MRTGMSRNFGSRSWRSCLLPDDFTRRDVRAKQLVGFVREEHAIARNIGLADDRTAGRKSPLKQAVRCAQCVERAVVRAREDKVARRVVEHFTLDHTRGLKAPKRRSAARIDRVEAAVGRPDEHARTGHVESRFAFFIRGCIGTFARRNHLAKRNGEARSVVVVPERNVRLRAPTTAAAQRARCTFCRMRRLQLAVRPRATAPPLLAATRERQPS